MRKMLRQFAEDLAISDLGVCQARTYADLFPILEKQDTPFCAEPRDRISPFTLLADAKSIIMCAFSYFKGHDAAANLSKYAWGRDYHAVVREKLQALINKMEQSFGPFHSFIFCDTSPLCDKYLAWLSGLGFFGDNHLLIHPVYGSYLFLGGILTSLDIEPDTPIQQHCLKCGKCIAACPSGALSSGRLNPYRCVSYLQQKKGELSQHQQKWIKNSGMVWGCDQCSDVCPHNVNIARSTIKEFEPISTSLTRQDLDSSQHFRQQFSDRAFAWRGKAVLSRNLKIVESNLSDESEK